MTASFAGWWHRLGYKQVAYEYDRNPRYAGSTKYPLAKMIGFAADALISFSMVPLRIATYVGALLTTVLTFVGIGAVISWILSGTVPGWTSLTLLVVMISSVQLLVLGLIGNMSAASISSRRTARCS